MRQERPLNEVPLEKIFDLSLEDFVEIKDSKSGEVIIQILSAQKGHPNYERNLNRIFGSQFAFPHLEIYNYPVASDNINAPIAEALGFPIEPLRGRNPAELLPVFEKMRALGKFSLDEEQVEKAEEVLKNAFAVSFVFINGEKRQPILLISQGGDKAASNAVEEIAATKGSTND